MRKTRNPFHHGRYKTVASEAKEKTITPFIRTYMSSLLEQARN